MTETPPPTPCRSVTASSPLPSPHPADKTAIEAVGTPPLPRPRNLAAELVDRGDGWHVSPHCDHWRDGDGPCCLCGEPNWCPESGETPEALARYEQRKGTCGRAE